MNRFRYDVVLRLGSSAKIGVDPPWLDWSDNGLTVEWIDQRLRHERTEILAITGIRNQRIEKDNFALEILTGKNAFTSVTELREALNNMTFRGVHPERLLSLAEELGYQMDFSWASAQFDGSYDAVFYGLHNAGQRSRLAFNWPRPKPVSSNMAHHVADPIRIDHRRKMIRYLQESIALKLGERFVPADFVILDAMPMTNSGDIDTSALPPPWLSGL